MNKILTLTALCFFAFIIEGWGKDLEIDPKAIRKSLVRILVSAQIPNFRTPWNPGKIGGGLGSGFIISKNRIMTNAHVVSNARYISLDKDGDSQKYPARILHIAHDCDLALLTVDDPDFFEDTTPLEESGFQ